MPDLKAHLIGIPIDGKRVLVLSAAIRAGLVYGWALNDDQSESLKGG